MLRAAPADAVRLPQGPRHSLPRCTASGRQRLSPPWLGESVSLVQMAGGATVLLGIAFVHRAAYTETEEHDEKHS